MLFGQQWKSGERNLSSTEIVVEATNELRHLRIYSLELNESRRESLSVLAMDLVL
jgi:hypothetical protein